MLSCRLSSVFQEQFAPDPEIPPNLDEIYWILPGIKDHGVSQLMKMIFFCRRDPHLIPKMAKLFPTQLHHRTARGYTAGHLAVTFAGSYCTEEVAQLILNADSTWTHITEPRPLLIQALIGLPGGYASRNTIDLLLRNGASPNSATGISPLEMAIRDDDPICVDLLLKAGANVDAVDAFGTTPLMMALYNLTIMRAVLVYHPNLEISHPTSGTALCMAANHHCIDMIRLLLQAGAAVNATDANDNTPLLLALQNRNENIAHVLLDADASIETTNSTGWNAILMCVNFGLESVFARLLPRARLDVLTSSGESLLQLSVRRGRCRMAKQFLEMNILFDVDQINIPYGRLCNGICALIRRVHRNREQMATSLLTRLCSQLENSECVPVRRLVD